MSGQALDFSGELFRMCSAMELTDVVLVSSNKKKVHAHKVVLSARSPVFKALFAERNKELKEGSSGKVQMPELSAAALNKFVRHLYLRTNQIAPDSTEEAVALIDASQMYPVNSNELVTACEKFLCQVVAADAEAVPGMLTLAKRYDLLQLKGECLGKWKTHRDAILGLDSFNKLIVGDKEVLRELFAFTAKTGIDAACEGCERTKRAVQDALKEAKKCKWEDSDLSTSDDSD